MSPPSRPERFVGCLLGLALGDACGAPLEGGLLERAVWKLLCLPGGSRLRWSDDTQMSLVLAESLVERKGLDLDALALSWAREAQWSRGYGPGALKVLRRVRAGEDWRSARTAVYPEGSWGNGGAMRSAPLGLFYARRPADLAAAAAEAAGITHAHPLGIEGAVLIARAAALLLEGAAPEGLLSALAQGAGPEYRAALQDDSFKTGTAAVESVPAALKAFARCPRDFGGLLAFVAGLGGDVDTVGAMAGALFGTLNGPSALPAELLARLEERERLEAAGRALCAASA